VNALCTLVGFVASAAHPPAPIQSSPAIRDEAQIKPLVEHSFEGARDMTGDPRVSLTAETAHDTYFAGEAILVRLRVAIDRSFLQQNMVQPYARQLDVPVRLHAAWLDDLPGASALDNEAEPRIGARSSFVLNDGVSMAWNVGEEIAIGRKLTVFEIERTYIAKSGGELAVPEALLYFAYATKFDQDPLSGRIAKDRIDAFVKSHSLALKILPLPEKGRPSDFTGAVGRYSLDAEVDRHSVAVGDSIKLTLHLTGEGNIAFFPAPTLRELSAFDVRGITEDHGWHWRAITYDISPSVPGAIEIGPIAFTYFDPTPPGMYTLSQAKPIHIDVRRATKAPGPDGATAPTKASDSTTPWLSIAVALLAAIAVVGVVRRASQRAGASRPRN
jgi:hypothetical protein